MKLSPGEQESIVALLTRIYLDISEIETDFGLMAGNGDFRTRIEYFHDAIRAFSSGDKVHLEEGGRLCIELLAYDLTCLRYIQDMPLSPFKPHAEAMSPKTDLMVMDNVPVVKPKRPDRQMRERISELYQNYAVLFAALLKPQADRDWHERTDNLNQDVEEIHTLMQQMDGLGKGKVSIETVMAAINHLEDGELRQGLMEFIHRQLHKKKSEIDKLNQLLKDQTRKRDKEIATIETAHMNYAMAQLAIFENSKDMLKKMAGQGMNLVGKFVEASINETRREMGR